MPILKTLLKREKFNIMARKSFILTISYHIITWYVYIKWLWSIFLFLVWHQYVSKIVFWLFSTSFWSSGSACNFIQTKKSQCSLKLVMPSSSHSNFSFYESILTKLKENCQISVMVANKRTAVVKMELFFEWKQCFCLIKFLFCYKKKRQKTEINASWKI